MTTKRQVTSQSKRGSTRELGIKELEQVSGGAVATGTSAKAAQNVALSFNQTTFASLTGAPAAGGVRPPRPGGTEV